MRIPSNICLLAVMICVSLSGLAESKFTGKWRTKPSRLTGKTTITVKIVESEGKLTGAVVLVNPDRSEIEMPILRSESKGNVLEFGTSLQGTPFDWRLTLKKGNRRALLHGSERRPSKGGSGGEMVIEENVEKTP